ncbi:MAG: sodium:solute symporter [Candidatus Thermoplasmatota archaeon]|jgi:SSS family solute:Na+ symporter|nr:sodium:solute symporter [Candidatus Thermoplasmatota archaeon]
MNNLEVFIVFISLFVLFVALGFSGSRFRKGDMSDLGEWAIAGRRLGGYLAWFLVGGDLYTAYTFIAIPNALFVKGAIYFFAVPYVGITFGVAMLTMPRLWKIAKEKNYVTAVDMVQDKFNSKSLAALIALTGIVAELPYIALQIYGMQAVLTVMIGQLVTVDAATITEIALIISFIILAAFTFTSGLRGAAVTAVMKDVIIFVTVIVVIVVVPMAIGGFGHAFSSMKALPTGNETLAPLFLNGFISLVIMSALALYLYPHAINAVLGTSSTKRIRYSTALLPIYGVGLALLALFGILAYGSTSTLAMISKYGPVTTVPSLIYNYFPSWFVGFAFLGIFIGGLVPASIMAISQANLLTRNVIKPYKKNMTPQQETRYAKYFSVIFKFIALLFIFVISATYSLQLQLLGGVIVLQTLPAIFIALFSNKLEKWSTGVGWAAGMFTGIYLLLAANDFNSITTVLFKFSTPLSFLYVGLIGLVVNLVIAVIGSLLVGAFRGTSSKKAAKVEQ